MSLESLYATKEANHLNFVKFVKDTQEFRKTLITDNFIDRVWAIVFRTMDLISSGIKNVCEWSNRYITPHLTMKNLALLTVTSLSCYYLYKKLI